jgi:hypothetical protein
MKLGVLGTVPCPHPWTLGGNELKLVLFVACYLCKNIVHIKEIDLDYYKVIVFNIYEKF